MDRATTVFWDGDTQRDFLEPTGVLYVPGSEAILANLARLTYLARAGTPRIRVIGSVCRHFPGDAELWSGGGPYLPCSSWRLISSRNRAVGLSMRRTEK